MKKSLVALVAIMVTATSYGQGAVTFNNHITGQVEGKVTLDTDSTKGPGALGGWVAQLMLVGANNALTPLTPSTDFRPVSSTGSFAATFYVNGVDITTVPGSPGDTVNMEMVAYKGASYDAAKATGFNFGQSPVFSQKLGGGTLPGENLVNLQGFTVTTNVPEPTTIALALLGGAALLIRRRK